MRAVLAASLLFVSSAYAQDNPPDAAPPAPIVSELAAPVSDPMDMVRAALAAGAEPQRCRFAFTRLIATTAEVLFADADAESITRFDPRLPIGQRWTVVSAERHERAIRRGLEREDMKGLPFDLIVLTIGGEWTYENLTLIEETPDRLIYSFAPRVIPARSASETGVGIIEQLIGRIELARDSGRIVSTTLREPPEDAVRALGIVRVRHANFTNRYDTGPDGFWLARSASQMMSMSALLTPTQVATQMRFVEIEPICDEAEIARIAAAEAAAVAAAAAPRRR